MNDKISEIDRDIELTKIALYSEHVHSRYMAMLPTSITIYLAFLIALWTFTFEGTLTLFGFIFALFVMSLSYFVGLYRFIRKYRTNMRKVSNYFDMIQNGEPLPKLIDM